MGKNSGKKFAIGTAVAAGVGYLAGILTAPKSGKETRADIGDAAIRTKAGAEKKFKELHSELDSLIASGSSKVGNLKDKAQVELKDAVAKAVTAKEKVRGILSAIHEGGTDDKDLQKALKEANKAVAHLRSFLSSDAK